jgi:hypothetical protein
MSTGLLLRLTLDDSEVVVELADLGRDSKMRKRN